MLSFLQQFADDTQIKISKGDLNLDNAPTSFDGQQIQNILMTVYFLAGVVAVIIIVIGGIRYTTSNGDSGQIKSAKDTILYAVVGLIVVIMAAAITGFILSNLS